MTLLKLFALYGAHLFWPFAAVCLWMIFRHKGWARYISAALLLAALPLAWARFVEPRILTVHHETILLSGASENSPSIRIALFADTHLGIFDNAMPLDRIARRINREQPDAVFLAGDLTYHPETEDIPDLFAPLASLEAPVYAVFGNHDVGFPGPNLSEPLMRAMQENGVRVIHNRAIETQLAGQTLILAGASDLWERKQNFAFKASLPEGVPVLLLTHNPDTALSVPENFPYALMLAGHTHGGQIRIPGIYRQILPVEGPFDKELHHFQTPQGERLIYVTTGTGMVGLPMRFLMPPRIDILTVHLPE